MLVGLLLASILAAKHVRLDAVGDVMLGRWIGRRIDRLGGSVAFAGVRQELQLADFVAGNLECALSNRPIAVQKRYPLRANPAYVRLLKGANFGVLSLANNHAGDCGPSGLLEAAELLRTNQIEAVGGEQRTAYITRKGLKMAFIGLTDLPGQSLNEASLALVREARMKAEVVIVQVHWGVEGSPTPSALQRSIAKRLALAGADLILGSHPHVLQPIQWCKGWHGRQTLVAYSLGNFVFDSPPGPGRTSEILKCWLGAGGVQRHELIPCRLHEGFPEIAKIHGRRHRAKLPHG